MHPAPGQGVQIGRKGGDQRLALTGFHLGNVALVQEHAAHQLRVKGPQTQSPARGLPAIGKCLGQQRIQAFTAFKAGFQLGRLVDQPLIGQSFEFRLKRIDFFDHRRRGLDLTVVRCAEHLARERAHSKHMYETPDAFV